MNIENYKKIVIEYKKKYAMFQIVSLSIIVLVGIIGLILFKVLKGKFDTGNLYIDNVLPVLPTALMVCVTIYLYFSFLRKYELGSKHKIGYHCPHCGAQLVISAQSVIATGNCPNCGKRVIDKD